MALAGIPKSSTSVPTIARRTEKVVPSGDWPGFEDTWDTESIKTWRKGHSRGWVRKSRKKFLITSNLCKIVASTGLGPTLEIGSLISTVRWYLAYTIPERCPRVTQVIFRNCIFRIWAWSIGLQRFRRWGALCSNPRLSGFTIDGSVILRWYLNKYYLLIYILM